MTHIIEFPFHIGDFLTGTIQMDAVEIGAYTMLMVAHYQAGVYGLPDDDERLARIARVTPKVWPRLRVILAEKFTVSDGRWVSERVVETLQKIEEKSLAAQENAEKRWQKNGEKHLDFFSQKAPNVGANPLKYINPPYADAYANHQPLTIDDKTPLPPLAGDNPGSGYGPVVVKGRIFDISEHLDESAWRQMTALRPLWDRHALIRRYNAWIASIGDLPRSPRAAFVGWLPKQPEKP